MMDVYQMVTDRIVALLEQGTIPWKKGWTGGADGARSWSSRKPYSLLNQMLLGKPGEYITFNQCVKAGGKVKKGSKARFVVFWKFLQKDKTDRNGNPVIGADGKPEKETIPMLKYYQVFHIDDCEGIEPHEKNPQFDFQPVEEAERVLADYISRSGVKLEHNLQDEAYYQPGSDRISLPLKTQFLSSEEYYGTAYHEAVHSTGHKSRLNRLATGMAAAFGGQDYSKEELVAEIGAAASMAKLGMVEATIQNSAAYIESWLKALKNDKRLIVTAASAAEKAVKLIFGEVTENVVD